MTANIYIQSAICVRFVTLSKVKKAGQLADVERQNNGSCDSHFPDWGSSLTFFDVRYLRKFGEEENYFLIIALATLMLKSEQPYFFGSSFYPASPSANTPRIRNLRMLITGPPAVRSHTLKYYINHVKIRNILA